MFGLGEHDERASQDIGTAISSRSAPGATGGPDDDRGRASAGQRPGDRLDSPRHRSPGQEGGRGRRVPRGPAGRTGRRGSSDRAGVGTIRGVDAEGRAAVTVGSRNRPDSRSVRTPPCLPRQRGRRHAGCAGCRQRRLLRSVTAVPAPPVLRRTCRLHRKPSRASRPDRPSRRHKEHRAVVGRVDTACQALTIRPA